VIVSGIVVYGAAAPRLEGNDIARNDSAGIEISGVTNDARLGINNFLRVVTHCHYGDGRQSGAAVFGHKIKADGSAGPENECIVRLRNQELGKNAGVTELRGLDAAVVYRKQSLGLHGAGDFGVKVGGHRRVELSGAGDEY